MTNLQDMQVAVVRMITAAYEVDGELSYLADEIQEHLGHIEDLQETNVALEGIIEDLEGEVKDLQADLEDARGCECGDS
jgi:hypothetical protein